MCIQYCLNEIIHLAVLLFSIGVVDYLTKPQGQDFALLVMGVQED